jgi:hypothetical protein
MAVHFEQSNARADDGCKCALSFPWRFRRLK